MDRREKPDNSLNRYERHLLSQVRDMKFGSMTIHVQNGEPRRIENRVDSIILGTHTGEVFP